MIVGGRVKSFWYTSHSIHVWYIYLHLPYFTIKNNQMYLPYMDGMGLDGAFLVCNQWSNFFEIESEFQPTTATNIGKKYRH